MIKLRPDKERGVTKFPWLSSQHSFSFGDYHDPQYLNFRSLRVINEDVIAPAQGFGMHAHRDAEIFTYVVAGELQHKDSLGNGSIIRAGHFQYMSAGSGVQHSEVNSSIYEDSHILQIWILPSELGGAPRYAEANCDQLELPENQLSLLFAGKSEDKKVIQIRQDAKIYFGKLSQDKKISFEISPERFAWIQIIQGKLNCVGQVLDKGDGAAISQETKITFTGIEDTEFLCFDLA